MWRSRWWQVETKPSPSQFVPIPCEPGSRCAVRFSPSRPVLCGPFPAGRVVWGSYGNFSEAEAGLRGPSRHARAGFGPAASPCRSPRAWFGVVAGQNRGWAVSRRASWGERRRPACRKRRERRWEPGLIPCLRASPPLPEEPAPARCSHARSGHPLSLGWPSGDGHLGMGILRVGVPGLCSGRLRGQIPCSSPSCLPGSAGRGVQLARPGAARLPPSCPSPSRAPGFSPCCLSTFV